MKTIAHEIFGTAGEFAGVLQDTINVFGLGVVDASLARAMRPALGVLVRAACFQKIHNEGSSAYASIYSSLSSISTGLAAALRDWCEPAWDAQGTGGQEFADSFVDGFGEIGVRMVALDAYNFNATLAGFVSANWPS